jgi:hypothetical protein
MFLSLPFESDLSHTSILYCILILQHMNIYPYTYLPKLLIVPVCSHLDVDIDHHNYMRRQVSLGLCFTLSLVLVFGSVLSLNDTRMAFAVDMSGAPATQDTTTAGSGEGDEDQGDNNDDQEDDPVTQDTITTGRGSDDSDDDNSGQSSDKNGEDGNDNERTTSNTEVTNRPDCPENQEPGLFITCMPQTCSNDIGSGSAAPILSGENNKCANSQYIDPSTRD